MAPLVIRIERASPGKTVKELRAGWNQTKARFLVISRRQPIRRSRGFGQIPSVTPTWVTDMPDLLRRAHAALEAKGSQGAGLSQLSAKLTGAGLTAQQAISMTREIRKSALEAVRESLDATGKALAWLDENMPFFPREDLPPAIEALHDAVKIAIGQMEFLTPITDDLHFYLLDRAAAVPVAKGKADVALTANERHEVERQLLSYSIVMTDVQQGTATAVENLKAASAPQSLSSVLEKVLTRITKLITDVLAGALAGVGLGVPWWAWLLGGGVLLVYLAPVLRLPSKVA